MFGGCRYWCATSNFVIKFPFYDEQWGSRKGGRLLLGVLGGQGAGRDEHAELVGRRPHAPQLLVAPAGLVLVVRRGRWIMHGTHKWEPMGLVRNRPRKNTSAAARRSIVRRAHDCYGADLQSLHVRGQACAFLGAPFLQHRPALLLHLPAKTKSTTTGEDTKNEGSGRAHSPAQPSTRLPADAPPTGRAGPPGAPRSAETCT